MPKYVTWEAARQRWVFQIHIPSPARHGFGGRIVVRKHLGNCEAPVAVAKGAQMARHYKRLFARYRPSGEGASTTGKPPEQLFLVDDDIAVRVVATWRLEQAQAFETRFDALRTCPQSDWDALESELVEGHTEARDALRRQAGDLLAAVKASMEARYRIRLQGDEAMMTHLARALNTGRLCFIEDCLTVVRGTQGIDALRPAQDSLLPLRELWGDAPEELLERWLRQYGSTRRKVNPKTRDKYAAIIRDLDGLLGRRPVQYLGADDLDALKTLWTSRGNRDTTIIDKLTSLHSLLRPFLPADRLEALFTLPTRSASRARRLPFTPTQLARLLERLGAEKKHGDDLMLVMLLVLLACRIEEACQLTAADLEPTDDGWLVRIADRRQTGSGSARVKNAASARRLPLRSRAFPALDRWLRARIAAGGFLFPGAGRNKYGIRSTAASRRINRVIRRLFPDDGRLVLQSLRNTAAQVLRRAAIDPRIRYRYLGHADGDIHRRHYDPGELLDAADLEPGSVALADFLLGTVGT